MASQAKRSTKPTPTSSSRKSRSFLSLSHPPKPRPTSKPPTRSRSAQKARDATTRDDLNSREKEMELRGAILAGVQNKGVEEIMVVQRQKKQGPVELERGGDGLAGALRELEMRLGV